MEKIKESRKRGNTTRKDGEVEWKIRYKKKNTFFVGFFFGVYSVQCAVALYCFTGAFTASLLYCFTGLVV